MSPSWVIPAEEIRALCGSSWRVSFSQGCPGVVRRRHEGAECYQCYWGEGNKRNKAPEPNSGTGGTAVAEAPAVCTPTCRSEVKQGVASIPSCTGCGVVIAQEVRDLQCDRCTRTDQWKCIECLDIPVEVYDALINCKS